MEAVKVGKRGTIMVPVKLRKRYGIEEGAIKQNIQGITRRKLSSPRVKPR
jgi:bifunctional DNA-binding transcriptional regulator/antitoxin component of YhaV-PrlF toxin-antitoxin module